MASDARFLVLVSRQDDASLTIRDALLEMHEWEEVGAFGGLPVRRFGRFLMVEIAAMHLDADLVDQRLKEAGWSFDTVLVASRHRAESGRPALTVHPIGNPVAADFGGRPRTLVPTDPIVMGRVLRRLHAEAHGLKHQVTFEATHHGPYLETPTMFVEIGTNEAAWTDRDLGRRVARSILAADTESVGDAAPVVVALGGSHYAPRIGDLVKQGRVNVGHILPAYALEHVDTTTAIDAVRQTPGCKGYYVDERTTIPDDLRQALGGLELGMWRDEDL